MWKLRLSCWSIKGHLRTLLVHCSCRAPGRSLTLSASGCSIRHRRPQERQPRLSGRLGTHPTEHPPQAIDQSSFPSTCPPKPSSGCALLLVVPVDHRPPIPPRGMLAGRRCHGEEARRGAWRDATRGMARRGARRGAGHGETPGMSRRGIAPGRLEAAEPPDGARQGSCRSSGAAGTSALYHWYAPVSQLPGFGRSTGLRAPA